MSFLAPYALPLTQQLLVQFDNLNKVYEGLCAKRDTQMEEFTDKEEQYGVDVLINAIIELMIIFQQSPEVRSQLLLPNFRTVLQDLLTFVQIQEEQMERWTESVNEYVLDEVSETSVRGSVRKMSSDFLKSLREHNVFVQIFGTELSELRESVDASNWRKQESWVFLLRSVFDEEIEDSEATNSATRALMSVAVDDSLHDLLRSSAILGLCSVPESSLMPLMSQATTKLAPLIEQQSMVLSVVSLKLFARLSRFMKNSTFNPYFLQLMMNLSSDCDEETKSLVVEAVCGILSSAENPTASLKPQDYSILLATIKENSSSLYISGLIRDCFEKLSSSASDPNSFCQIVFPRVYESLADSGDDSNIRSIMLDILKGIIDGADARFPAGLVEDCLIKITEAFQEEVDADVLQSIQLLFASLVNTNSENIRRIQLSDGRSGTSIIINFLAQCLSPKLEDSAGIFVENVFFQLYEHVSVNLEYSNG